MVGRVRAQVAAGAEYSGEVRGGDAASVAMAVSLVVPGGVRITGFSAKSVGEYRLALSVGREYTRALEAVWGIARLKGLLVKSVGLRGGKDLVLEVELLAHTSGAAGPGGAEKTRQGSIR